MFTVTITCSYLFDDPMCVMTDVNVKYCKMKYYIYDNLMNLKYVPNIKVIWNNIFTIVIIVSFAVIVRKTVTAGPTFN